MDAKAIELLQEIASGQRKQTELLEKHLGRFRFSLRLLLVLTTLTALGLGYVGYKTRNMATISAVPAPPVSVPAGAWPTTSPPTPWPTKANN